MSSASLQTEHAETNKNTLVIIEEFSIQAIHLNEKYSFQNDFVVCPNKDFYSMYSTDRVNGQVVKHAGHFDTYQMQNKLITRKRVQIPAYIYLENIKT